MHHCLEVDEIVRFIASELVEARGMGTAVSLACCCRSLEDPVLDTLWSEDQDLFITLLETLPEDIWEDPSSGKYMSFRRPPTTQELSRLQKYGRRMRTLKGSFTSRSHYYNIIPVPQLSTLHGSLLPNLKTLHVHFYPGRVDDMPSTHMLLSPGLVAVSLRFITHGKHAAIIASTIATLSASCPNLRKIHLNGLPDDPRIISAVSHLILATNQGILQEFEADSLLTEEAREVVYKLTYLSGLWTIIDGATSLPTIVLPNLTSLGVTCKRGFGWLQGFRGASFEKLSSVSFYPVPHQVEDFLEAFESATLATSLPTTLSSFELYGCPRRGPNYRALLQFTQLRTLTITGACYSSCSSTVDDDLIFDLSTTMPKLEHLRLGGNPCEFEPAAAVTTKGLSLLSYNCPRLSDLCIHFRLDGFNPPEVPENTSLDKRPPPRRDCSFGLHAGRIQIPEGSTLMIASTLLRIFPHLERVNYNDNSWEGVARAIRGYKEVADWSGE